jgi:sugar lactone lactonase YvrE
VDILNARLLTYSPTSGKVSDNSLQDHTGAVTTVVPVASSGSAGAASGVGVSNISKVVLGTTEGVALYDLDSGQLEQHPANGTLHGEHTRMNDGKCDPQGIDYIVRVWSMNIEYEYGV